MGFRMELRQLDFLLNQPLDEADAHRRVGQLAAIFPDNVFFPYSNFLLALSALQRPRSVNASGAWTPFVASSVFLSSPPNLPSMSWSMPSIHW